MKEGKKQDESEDWMSEKGGKRWKNLKRERRQREEEWEIK